MSAPTPTAAGSAAAPAVPLVAVDLVEIRSDHEVFAVKLVNAADPYLSGHYPGRPLYPGVFVVESARQAVDHLVRNRYGPDHGAELRAVAAARFTAPSGEGDELRLHVQCHDEPAGEIRAEVRCVDANDGSVARMTLRLRIVEPGNRAERS